MWPVVKWAGGTGIVLQWFLAANGKDASALIMQGDGTFIVMAASALTGAGWRMFQGMTKGL